MNESWQSTRALNKKQHLLLEQNAQRIKAPVQHLRKLKSHKRKRAKKRKQPMAMKLKARKMQQKMKRKKMMLLKRTPRNEHAACVVTNF